MKPTRLKILALTAPLLAFAFIADAQQFGNYLAARGYRVTVWMVPSPNGWARAYGTFNPSVLSPNPVACTDPDFSRCIKAFNDRYGGPGKSVWGNGNSVGERFNDVDLQSFFWLVGLPGTPTDLDNEDAKLVLGAWDNLIEPLTAGAVTKPTTTPPVTPPVVPPVVPVTPKPPAAPPACADGGPDGAQPGAVVTPILKGWYYRPGLQSTGQLNLLIIPGPDCTVVKKP